jgi:hypothetical protein
VSTYEVREEYAAAEAVPSDTMREMACTEQKFRFLAVPCTGGRSEYARHRSYRGCGPELVPDGLSGSVGPQMVDEVNVWPTFEVVSVLPQITVIEVEELPI